MMELCWCRPLLHARLPSIYDHGAVLVSPHVACTFTFYLRSWSCVGVAPCCMHVYLLSMIMEPCWCRLMLHARLPSIYDHAAVLVSPHVACTFTFYLWWWSRVGVAPCCMHVYLLSMMMEPCWCRPMLHARLPSIYDDGAVLVSPHVACTFTFYLWSWSRVGVAPCCMHVYLLSMIMELCWCRPMLHARLPSIYDHGAVLVSPHVACTFTFYLWWWSRVGVAPCCMHVYLLSMIMELCWCRPMLHARLPSIYDHGAVLVSPHVACTFTFYLWSWSCVGVAPCCMHVYLLSMIMEPCWCRPMLHARLPSIYDHGAVLVSPHVACTFTFYLWSWSCVGVAPCCMHVYLLSMMMEPCWCRPMLHARLPSIYDHGAVLVSPHVACTFPCAGVQNITALGTLITWQKVEYDFDFHRQDFPCNIPALVLSEGKSILKVTRSCSSSSASFPTFIWGRRFLLNPVLRFLPWQFSLWQVVLDVIQPPLLRSSSPSFPRHLHHHHSLAYVSNFGGDPIKCNKFKKHFCLWNWAHCYPRGVATVPWRAAILVLHSNAPVINAKTGEHDFTGSEYRSSEAIPA